jgi:hypothetical protein
VVESSGLLNRRRAKTLPGVRIPPSPPDFFERSHSFFLQFPTEAHGAVAGPVRYDVSQRGVNHGDYDGSRSRGSAHEGAGRQSVGSDGHLGVRCGSDAAGPRGPNTTTVKAMRAADKGKGKRMGSAGALFKDLGICPLPDRASLL